MGITFVRRHPEETVYAYLERRERELLNQISAEKAATATKEMELAHVQSAKRQIGNLGGADKARFGVSIGPAPTVTDLIGDDPNAEQPDGASIKQLILRAMWA